MFMEWPFQCVQIKNKNKKTQHLDRIVPINSSTAGHTVF